MSSTFPKTPTPPRPLWRGLQQKFSPSQYLRRAAELARVGGGNGSPEWILARGLCVFSVVDAAKVPPRQRRAFVKTMLARSAPFADPDLHVEWVGDRAMLWSWSRGLIAEQVPGRDASAAPRRVLPETLFRSAPRLDGEELVRMDDGVEARVWRGNALVASEWWPQVPSLEDWNAFRRGSGLAPGGALPLVAEPVLLETPWSARKARPVSDIANRYRAWLLAGGLGLCAAVFMVPLASALRLSIASWQVEGDIQALDSGTKRIVDAREAALRDVGEIGRLLDLRPPAGQLELMAAVQQLTPGSAWEVREWRMPDASTLEVELKMDKPDPAALASAWEASPLFESVAAELGPAADAVRMKARISRRASEVAR